MTSDTAIAVVGMACRLPGAADLAGYWTLLRDGVEGISHFDRDQLVARGANPEQVRRPDFVPAKGVLAGADEFDWAFFGYSRAEAASIDPQQRVFLECAANAVDDAGIDPTRFPGWIGVYAGADAVGLRPDENVSELANHIGQEKDFLATRVAYKLGLRGPAVTVQTACSTSLTAIHLAASSLRGQECDVALAGGVTVTARGEWGYLYEEGGILSPDGHCRPFDVRAAGTVPSEGVGVVVLKRLADARRDGDRIIAVIHGSAINNDGSDKLGYTAPSIPGQSDVIRYAQTVAGVDPADIDYVEAHGTATKLGDPVEVAALTDVFGASTNDTGWCRLGAVKSNIGHAGAAAGVAGFIKTALLLSRRELVPTVHFGAPSPLLELDRTPFRISTGHEPWPDRGVALAAVSSFGVGGTNAHVVVGAAAQRARPSGRGGTRLIPVSAASPTALARLRDRLADHLRTEDVRLPEVSRTLVGRRIFPLRQAFVGASPAEVADALSTGPEPGPAGLGKVAFLFPGQGTLRTPAAGAAYRLLGGFRDRFAELRDLVLAEHKVDLSPVVATEPVPPDWFADTVHQQLGLFAVGCALCGQLADWGVRPVALLGNSIGEYAAAVLAGVWSAPEAAGLVYERARAMWATEPGRMATVAAPAAEVARRIDPDSGVSIAVSGVDGVVLSGRAPEMAALLAGDALHGLEVRELNTRRAFHSPAMEPAVAALRAALTPGNTPNLRIIANTTGDWADPAALRGADYWARQLVEPVLLAEGMRTLLGCGAGVFLELGPGSSMLSPLRRAAGWQPAHTTIPLLGRADADPEHSLLRALGTLWERGVDGVLDELADPPDDRPLRCALPAHPFAAGNVDLPPARQTGPRQARHTGVRAVLADVWCTALGTESVAGADDFYALGGESLLAINLLSRVRERTGISVSVSEFSTRPTFGALAALAEREQPRDLAPVPGCVRLAEGPGRPLFLVADATGTTLGYRALAGQLATGRPVYGLEPTRHNRIEDTASSLVDGVLATQPTGPYTLLGWSFGATVAHELARQLIARGATVDLVIGLDGYPPANGVPVAARPDFLISSLRLMAGAALGVGPVGAQIRRSPTLRARFVANLAALLRYRPRPVDCAAVVLRASGNAAANATLRARLAGLYRTVRVVPVPGDHWSMLTRPHVDELARTVREVVAATVESGNNGVS